MSPSSSPPVKPVTEPGKLTAPWGASMRGPGGRSSPSAWLPPPSFCGAYWEKRLILMYSWRRTCTSSYLACLKQRRSKINQVNVGLEMCIYFRLYLLWNVFCTISAGCGTNSLLKVQQWSRPVLQKLFSKRWILDSLTIHCLLWNFSWVFDQNIWIKMLWFKPEFGFSLIYILYSNCMFLPQVNMYLQARGTLQNCQW